MIKRTIHLATALTLAVGCAQKDPRYCDEETPCESAEYPYCDLDGTISGTKNQCVPEPQADAAVTRFDGGVGDANSAQCTPDSTSCENGELTTCDSDGNVASVDPCELGCHDGGQRCSKLDPSNGLASQLDAAAQAPAVVLNDGAVIDTSNETVTQGGGGSLALSTAIDDSGAVGIFIIRAKSLTAGDVTVQGERALAIVSDGDIVLDGVLSVSAEVDVNGPGALPSSGCTGGNGQDGNTDGDKYEASGAGGGGFGTVGGDGGSVTGFSGGAGGQPTGNASLEPLRGGCPGGHGSGEYDQDPTRPDPGGGGGAVQIVSRTEIELIDGAFVAANGGAAKGKDPPDGTTLHCAPIYGPCSPGNGGGSGGGMLLEAPSIKLSATSGVVANGGGGSCGEYGMAESGQLSTTPAKGQDCSTNDYYGNGGDGAAGTIPAANGANRFSNGGHGGGGGGGLGRIRINLPLGSTFSPPSSAVLSPQPSVGTLETR